MHEFLDDPSPDKRRRLVDRLLAGPAYVAHFTTIERRLMIPEADTNRQLRLVAPAFEAWLRQQVAGNVGYDRIVRELLTVPVAADRSRQPTPAVPGLGRVQEPSPLPFYLAKEVKRENLAASTARLFLGLRLECAQCHNHPFATWTREQFWGYAAFFSSLEPQGPPAAVALAGRIREVPNRHEATIPGTSKVVQATFLDGSAPEPGGPRSRRGAILADWMTAPENPFFARAAVNRIWAQLFGIGLVDPVDDMGADNPPSHPELLDALARSFVDHGFDRKFLIRAIVLSRPYQLSSAGPRADEAVPVLDASEDLATSRLFARMAVRGLSGEQLYDSLAQAIGLAAEEAPGRAVRGRGEYAPRRVPGEVRPPGRAADRGADVDPPGPRPDERPVCVGGDQPRGRGDALGGRRGAVPRPAGPGRDPLPRDPEPAAHARGVGPPGRLSSSAEGRPGTGARPSRTCSGPC